MATFCQAIVRIAPLAGSSYSAKLHRCTREAAMQDRDGRCYCAQHAKMYAIYPKPLAEKMDA